jgi:beta-glucosidase/6-phospho-beta-glucosidase/beta-galactosidase
LARFPFPDRPRLFGVAVWHDQVEGGDPCDWSAWESAGHTRGGPCGGAVGAWTRYEADADLAASLGSNAFRFSVSWSRVEPRPGAWNDDALDRDARLVEHLVARGVEPVVTLFHCTHPVWFQELSPWSAPASACRCTATPTGRSSTTSNGEARAFGSDAERSASKRAPDHAAACGLSSGA